MIERHRGLELLELAVRKLHLALGGGGFLLPRPGRLPRRGGLLLHLGYLLGFRHFLDLVDAPYRRSPVDVVDFNVAAALPGRLLEIGDVLHGPRGLHAEIVDLYFFHSLGFPARGPGRHRAGIHVGYGIQVYLGNIIHRGLGNVGPAFQGDVGEVGNVGGRAPVHADVKGRLLRAEFINGGRWTAFSRAAAVIGGDRFKLIEGGQLLRLGPPGTRRPCFHRFKFRDFLNRLDRLKGFFGHHGGLARVDLGHFLEVAGGHQAVEIIHGPAARGRPFLGQLLYEVRDIDHFFEVLGTRGHGPLFLEAGKFIGFPQTLIAACFSFSRLFDRQGGPDGFTPGQLVQGQAAEDLLYLGKLIRGVFYLSFAVAHSMDPVRIIVSSNRGRCPRSKAACMHALQRFRSRRGRRCR